MPWSIRRGFGGCDGYAVVKDSDDSVIGCHDTQDAAEEHLTALRIAESEKSVEGPLDGFFDTMDRILKEDGSHDENVLYDDEDKDEAGDGDKATATGLDEGTIVSWPAQGGRMIGRVQMVVTAGTVESSVGAMQMTASTDEPAVVVELIDDDGQPTGTTVIHRPERLTVLEEKPGGTMSTAPVEVKRTRVGESGVMQYKARVQSYETKDEGDHQEFVFTAMGSVYGNKDLGGDIAEFGMMAKTINDNDGRFPFIADHDFTLHSRLGVTQATETRSGVETTNYINLGTQFGREVASHVKHAEKHDIPLGMSFGYQVIKDQYDEEKQARRLKEVKVFEFTLTQIPMNPEARVTSVEGVKSALLSDRDALYRIAQEVKALMVEEGAAAGPHSPTGAADDDKPPEEGHLSDDEKMLAKDIVDLVYQTVRQDNERQGVA